jgi:cellulose synthase/poly-beta-1,6-N-acetylglucosamine synthase-like glycosyltransferase
VVFKELDRNIGRARIRNRLADMAKYSTLLFMDCDSQVSDDQYINRYIPFFGKDVVVCGGGNIILNSLKILNISQMALWSQKGTDTF